MERSMPLLLGHHEALNAKQQKRHLRRMRIYEALDATRDGVDRTLLFTLIQQFPEQATSTDLARKFGRMVGEMNFILEMLESVHMVTHDGRTWKIDPTLVHYQIYVLHLKDEAKQTKKMRKQNDGFTPTEPECLYVGMTGLPSEERVQNHVEGIHSCNLVKRFYRGDRFTQYPLYGIQLPYELAVEAERDTAKYLRTRGFHCYQN